MDFAVDFDGTLVADRYLYDLGMILLENGLIQSEKKKEREEI